MKTEYKGVNVVITGDPIGITKGKEISSKDLADILSKTSYQTIREAISKACEKDDSMIIGLAQCVHGVLYVKYNKVVKKGCH